MEHEDRVRTLEAQVAELTTQLQQLHSMPEDIVGVSVDDVGVATSSRRRMLRNVALAAGGAVAATVVTGVGTAAAIHQAEDLGLGIVNTPPPTKTSVNFTPPGTTTLGNGFLFQAGSVYGTDDSSFPSAVAAWTSLANYPTGLYAFAGSSAPGQAVAAIGSGTQAIGIRATGGKAAAVLTPNGAAGPARTDAHEVGELIEDTGANLWLCTTAGTPGTWRKLAGPASAGSFHAIAPVRVYDSRLPAPTTGKLPTGGSRVVSVKDGRDQTTGAVTAADVVPAGATAVFYNLTVTDTDGSAGGFLSVVPGDATAASGSSINWFGPGQIVANGLAGKVDASRQFKVFCGGINAAATHFLIDVTGYYL